MKRDMHDGWALALAWPETYCKQAGAWYDNLANFLGISKNNYYRAGHAAIVLIENGNSEPKYFDFGRYHAPFGHGRVRDKNTDHELRLLTKIKFDTLDNVLNITELLAEIQDKPACHGTGILKAGITKIVVKKAHDEAKEMQGKGPIAYGPFLKGGTNCSRFVNEILKAGRPPFLHRMRLTMPPMLTPTPFWNVKAIGDITNFFDIELSNQSTILHDTLSINSNSQIAEVCH